MEFGDYITNEYSILKNIFSFLTGKELRVCSQVCREWKKMADKFIEYNVECIRGKQEEVQNLDKVSKLVNPAMILHLLTSNSTNTKSLDEKICKTYDVDDVPIYYLVSCGILYTPCKRGKIQSIPEYELASDYASAFFPRVPGLKIKSFDFTGKTSVKPEMVEPLLGAKGVILLGDSSNPCVNTCKQIAKNLYYSAPNRKEVRAERPCLAGGLLVKIFRVTPPGRRKSAYVTAIALGGDNVTIHCDINRTSKFDDFFKELSERSGPKPPNADRYAFIFNCIGRYNGDAPGKNDEIAVFRKYFPGVPYFGFWSYGEFCIPDSHGASSSSSAKKIKIDRNLNLLNSACASYMIVTVNIPHGRPP
ncbi:Hypothetical protein NTJ_11676 [Nesidiocoris tenuis]|uniref:F-box domain-containing protein n=1 Tax=Nesidiocoris tenuis TaxID=355587 RepID=A0ABN7B375_9HEMI|nr:Hypothetical protein NTJ_11676 [Nesidiocoris tenuis]